MWPITRSVLKITGGALTAVLVASVHPAAQASRIAVTAVEQAERQPYDAERDQASLVRPERWCAAPRPLEPLLAEVSALVADAQSADAFRVMNGLPSGALGAPRVITNEALCEAAAKAYDRVEYQGTDEVHTSIAAVLVVSAGTVYFVDDLRDRDQVWLVVPFDGRWNPLAMPYGGGH
jgi:hypothetical protein